MDKQPMEWRQMVGARTRERIVNAKQVTEFLFTTRLKGNITGGCANLFAVPDRVEMDYALLADHRLHEYEIKVSRADFMNELNGAKADKYRVYSEAKSGKVDVWEERRTTPSIPDLVRTFRFAVKGFLPNTFTFVLLNGRKWAEDAHEAGLIPSWARILVLEELPQTGKRALHYYQWQKWKANDRRHVLDADHECEDRIKQRMLTSLTYKMVKSGLEEEDETLYHI